MIGPSPVRPHKKFLFSRYLWLENVIHAYDFYFTFIFSRNVKLDPGDANNLAGRVPRTYDFCLLDSDIEISVFRPSKMIFPFPALFLCPSVFH